MGSIDFARRPPPSHLRRNWPPADIRSVGFNRIGRPIAHRPFLPKLASSARTISRVKSTRPPNRPPRISARAGLQSTCDLFGSSDSVRQPPRDHFCEDRPPANVRSVRLNRLGLPTAPGPFSRESPLRQLMFGGAKSTRPPNHAPPTSANICLQSTCVWLGKIDSASRLPPAYPSRNWPTVNVRSAGLNRRGHPTAPRPFLRRLARSRRTICWVESTRPPRKTPPTPPKTDLESTDVRLG